MITSLSGLFVWGAVGDFCQVAFVLLPSDKFCIMKIKIYKTDHHDIAEILLKMALNTLTLTRFMEPGVD